MILYFEQELAEDALSWTANIPTSKYFDFSTSRLEENINFDLQNMQNKPVLFSNQLLSDFNKTGHINYILTLISSSFLMIFSALHLLQLSCLVYNLHIFPVKILQGIFSLFKCQTDSIWNRYNIYDILSLEHEHILIIIYHHALIVELTIVLIILAIKFLLYSIT